MPGWYVLRERIASGGNLLFRRFPRSLKQKAPLKICVRVNDGVEVGLVPGAVFFHLLDFRLVSPLKDSVAGDMVSLLVDVFPDTVQDIFVVHPC